MTQEERDFITAFIQRVGGPAAAPQGFGTRFGGSVPATMPQSTLPPMDRDADALLAELFTRHPEARYRISQLAFVQEQALVEAQNRLARMEWELEQARAAAAPRRSTPPPGARPSPSNPSSAASSAACSAAARPRRSRNTPRRSSSSASPRSRNIPPATSPA